MSSLSFSLGDNSVVCHISTSENKHIGIWARAVHNSGMHKLCFTFCFFTGTVPGLYLTKSRINCPLWAAFLQISCLTSLMWLLVLNIPALSSPFGVGQREKMHLTWTWFLCVHGLELLESHINHRTATAWY